ncbi:DUF4364 family protein [Clostridium oceanicum]|uniref:DUF4364 family protein n=1 Tax=Clostridium oceanicum TaxID=1543 RepID=A0ABP3V716_9CLOT
MFKDALELAENKLLILYIFSKFDIPISNNKITEIVLENNLINYFTLQQYISELTSSNFLRYNADKDKHRMSITKKGLKVLSMFIDRVTEDKITIINDYLKQNLNLIKKEISVTADYTIKNKDFIVNLKAEKDNSLLIDLKIPVDSNEQAKKLCSNWKKNSPELYKNILDVLNLD